MVKRIVFNELPDKSYIDANKNAKYKLANKINRMRYKPFYPVVAET